MKKLIPALCLLLVTAVMMGTSTFAWFSMNDTVSASGMSVKAVNYSGTLIIGTDTEEGAPSVTSLRATYSPAVALTGGLKNLSPAAVKSDVEDLKIETLETKANWYYEIGADIDASAGTGEAAEIPSFDGYVAKYNLYVCVAAGSAEMTDLTANVTIQADEGAQNVRKATRVIVATSQAGEEFSDNSEKQTGTVTLWDSIKPDDENPVKLVVYVYIDGNDDAVFTNNADNLASTTIQIELKATPATAEPEED